MRDIAEHVVATALRGQTLAAADHVLVNEAWTSELRETTAAVLTRVDAAFKTTGVAGRQRLVRFLLQLGMNLAGAEARLLRLPPEDIQSVLASLNWALGECAQADSESVRQVIDAILTDMRSVNRQDSLPALVAEGIAAEIAAAPNPGQAFLRAFGKQVKECVYARLSAAQMAKFGNDYARGLEYLRHLGFVQVSTNPVLAAKAFDEDPLLLDALRAEAKTEPAWLAAPDKHGDAQAMRATLLALWPNLKVFRPLAWRARNSDYLVSFQLNPNLADDAELSLHDALSAYRQAAEFLAAYDSDLGVPEPGAVPPCLVFKVAGNHPAARILTRELNAQGIGTNNTLVYSVAQAVRLTLDAFEGKARALKANKPITRTYMTNMGGRFTSHLREVEAERIVLAAVARARRTPASLLLNRLAETLQVDPSTPARMTVEQQARILSSFKYLKSLDQPAFLDLAAAAGYEAASIRGLEADLRKAGTLVARRVWRIFYAPAHRKAWIAWLSRVHQISSEQAQQILESMDVLPASKRVVEDTLHALGYPNMCHTEFPNHARAVQRTLASGFCLEDLRDSVLLAYPAEVVERLSCLADFRAGYELTGDLADLVVNEVGIAEAAQFGRGGLDESQWSAFGPAAKTAAEFRAAYDQFVARCRQVVEQVRQESQVEAAVPVGSD